MAKKVDFEKQYQVFRRLLRMSDKELPLSEIMEFINKIIVDTDNQIVIRWCVE